MSNDLLSAEHDLSTTDARCSERCLGLDLFDTSPPLRKEVGITEVEACDDCGCFPDDEVALKQLRVWLAGLRELVAAARDVYVSSEDAEPINISRIRKAIEPFDAIIV